MAASCRLKSSTDRRASVDAKQPKKGPAISRALLRSGNEIRILRMLVEIIDDETAARDHLPAVAADQVERALDQLGGNAAATQRARRLRVGDDHRRRRQPVIGEGDFAFDIE